MLAEDDESTPSVNSDDTIGPPLIVPASPATEEAMEVYLCRKCRLVSSYLPTVPAIAPDDISEWNRSACASISGGEHGFHPQLVESLRNISEEFNDEFSDATDMEVEIGPYRPTRSRFTARLCIRLWVNNASEITDKQRRDLQAFVARNGAALCHVKGLSVYGSNVSYPHWQNEGPGIRISAIATFLECFGAQTQMRLDLFQLHSPSTTDYAHSTELPIDGGCDEWDHFAATLKHYSSSLSYFRLRADIRNQDNPPGDACLNRLLDTLHATWCQNEAEADYFEINSHQFFEETSTNHIARFTRYHSGCKLRINFRGNTDAVRRFVDAVCENQQFGSVELVVENFPPILAFPVNDERYIEPPLIDLLESQSSFGKISYKYTAVGDQVARAGSDGRAVPYWKAALWGVTGRVTLDFREGCIGGVEPDLATELRNAALLQCGEKTHYVLTFANDVYGYVNAVFTDGKKCVELRLPFNLDGTSPFGVPPSLAAEGDDNRLNRRIVAMLHQSGAPVWIVHQFLMNYPETVRIPIAGQRAEVS